MNDRSVVVSQGSATQVPVLRYGARCRSSEVTPPADISAPSQLELRVFDRDGRENFLCAYRNKEGEGEGAADEAVGAYVDGNVQQSAYLHQSPRQ